MLRGQRRAGIITMSQITNSLDPQSIDCKTACVNGCVLGDQCPNQEFAKAATQFIWDTPLDKLNEIAAARFTKPFESQLQPIDLDQIDLEQLDSES